MLISAAILGEVLRFAMGVHSLCTAAPPLQKESGRSVSDLLWLSCSKTMWLFLECVENDVIGYFPYIITSLK